MVTLESPQPAVLLTDPDPVAKPGVWRGYWPVALVALSFAPLLAMHARLVWARPHYQFFPLVVPGAIALAWQSCRRLGPLEPGRRASAWGLAGLGWFLLALSLAFVSPPTAAVAALVTVLAGLYGIGGWPLLRAALPAWGLLWLAVPPPMQLDVTLIVKLQRVVSRWSSELLDLLGVFHLMDGNIVNVDGQTFFVDQACSGINSLLVMLIGTLFYVLWYRTPWPRATLLLLCSVFWVLYGNVVRIVAVVLINTRLGIDAAHGWKHTTLGMVLFLAMLGMVLSTDHLASFLGAVATRVISALRGLHRGEKAVSVRGPGYDAWPLVGGSRPRGTLNLVASPSPPRTQPEVVEPVAHPIVPSTLAEPDAAPTQMPNLSRTWLGSKAMLTAFILLMLPQFVMPGVTWSDVLGARNIFETPFKTLGKDAMPATFGPYKLVHFDTAKRENDDNWGEFSRIWYYESPTHGVSVSLDYQFIEWHELTDCYRGAGWTMVSRQAESPRDTNDGPTVTADFYNLEGRVGHLRYGLYDHRGRPLEPMDVRGLTGKLRRRLESWVRTSDRGGSDGQPVTYQVQAFASGERGLNADQRKQLDALLAEARKRIESQGLRVGGPNQS